MKTFFLGIIAAVTITIAAITPSHAMSISSAARSIAAAMPVQAAEFSERAKLSHRLFCLQLGNECRTGGKSVVAYTNKLRTVLTSVNRSVDSVMPAIRAEREFLSLSPLPGLGDDYAIMKRSQLIKAGLPAGSMRLADVVQRGGRRHSVLIVATSNGDFVLDHRQQAVFKRRDGGSSLASLADLPSLD